MFCNYKDYKIKFPSHVLHSLWLLREYLGAPAISVQIRQAVADYLQRKEKDELGGDISDLANAVAEHDREKISRE